MSRVRPSGIAASRVSTWTYWASTARIWPEIPFSAARIAHLRLLRSARNDMRCLSVDMTPAARHAIAMSAAKVVPAEAEEAISHAETGDVPTVGAAGMAAEEVRDFLCKTKQNP